MSQIKLINLCLLVLFPCAWFAPLLRAGLLPLFGLSEITLVTGLQSLWQNDKFLAIIVFLCAFLAPYAKIIGLALVHFDRLSRRILTAAVPAWQIGDGRGVSHRALCHGDQRHWHWHGRNRMGPFIC